MHVPAQSSTPDLVPITRALLSVSDKTGIADFAAALQREFNIELVSTGGTAKTLREAGLMVSDVSDLTGFPEMMDGRVKTLHPNIHGGFLALRDNPDHLAAMQQHHILPIDLVVVNLYPFEQTIAKPHATFEEAIENIDIGGPAMIRSAAKNHRSIAVVTDPFQYDKVLKHLRANQGQTPYRFRLDLAMWAYTRTAQYDAAIYPYLATHYFRDMPEKTAEHAGVLPALTPRLHKIEDLRYGENPHQAAAFYGTGATRASIATAKQLHGKSLSYINILDADAALELVREFQSPAAAVIKHTNPCGCAIAGPGQALAHAFDAAYAGDPVAAFGGIVALNSEVDLATAQAIVAGKRFLEVIIAPTYAPEALELLKDRWKDCRILAVGALDHDPAAAKHLHLRSVTGGILVQQFDHAGFDKSACTVTSARQPTEEEWRDLEFIWLVTKHVKSNAIAIGRSGQLLAAGAGQMSRPMSAKIAIELAHKNGHEAQLKGSSAGSDAFFPFPDAPELLINAGVTAIIHPGGSKKDQETIDLANQHHIALVATGERHFAH